jgi:hypothetical protein
VRSGFAIALAVLPALLLANGAAADPAPPEDKALAESLFREGRSLVEAGELERACAKFAERQRIEPKLGTLLHLATCHEQTGRIASAWAEYGEAAAQAARLHEPERQRIANERAAAIEPKLARIRVVLAAASPRANLELRLDGRTLRVASTNVPLPVDPGTHVVEANAPRRKPWRAEVVPRSGVVTDVTVPELEPLPAPPTPVVHHAAPPPIPASSPPAVGPVTLALGGAAVASVAIGTVFGLRFLSQRSDGLSECDGAICSARGLDDLDRARTSSLISGIALGVGVAALAGAVVVHVAGVGRDRTSAVAIGPGGVRIGGAW